MQTRQWLAGRGLLCPYGLYIDYEEEAQTYKDTQDPEILGLVYSQFGRVVSYFRRKYSFFFSDDEVGSLSLQAAHRALLLFDGDKGMKFATFYAMLLRHEIQNAIRSVRKAQEVSLEEVVHIAADTQELECAELRAAFHHLGLSKAELAFCLAVISEPQEKGLSEICRQIRVSRSTGYRMVTRLSRRMEALLYSP